MSGKCSAVAAHGFQSPSKAVLIVPLFHLKPFLLGCAAWASTCGEGFKESHKGEHQVVDIGTEMCYCSRSE